jgi:SAM-dependent methyltransferase
MAVKLVPFYQRGWSVAGVDLNSQAIAVAQAAFPSGHFWCGDLLKLDIADRFDVIRTDSVVEHLLDPIAYLSKLASLLKPGGRIRVIVPNARAFSAIIFERYSYVYWMPFHINLFNARTLRSILTRVGLVDIQCQTFTPVASWTHTWRQWLLAPGYDCRPPSVLDKIIRNLSLLNYPGECVAQWMGLGEELVATARRAATLAV